MAELANFADGAGRDISSGGWIGATATDGMAELESV